MSEDVSQTPPEAQTPLAPFKQKAMSWHEHWRYFRKLFAQNPSTAWSVWRQTYSEQGALKEAIAALHERSLASDFQWTEVPAALAGFSLPADDFGQAEWYAEAHRHYQYLVDTVLPSGKFLPKHLVPLLKELKFIKDAHLFHQTYQLTELQQEIRKMYDQLQQHLDAHNTQIKSSVHEKSALAAIEKLKAEEAVTRAEAERLAQLNQLTQEQRLKIEEENRALDVRRAADEAEALRLEKQQEFNLENAQRERQAQIQASLQGMSWGETGAEPKPENTIDQRIEALLSQLTTQETLSEKDMAATAKLYDILRKKFGV